MTTAELHIALAGASAWRWTGTGQRVEALRICERALQRVDERTAPALEARLLSEWCVLPSSPPVPAELAAAERAVALFRSLGDTRNAYIALERLQINANRRGDVAMCERVAAEMSELHDASWPPASRWHLLMARAVCLSESRQVEAARNAFQECLQLARTVRESRHIYVSLRWLVDIASETGRFQEAVALARELVALTRADRFASGLAMALCDLSAALVQLDQLDEALTAAREAVPLHAQQGTPMWVWLMMFARIACKQRRVSDAALAFGRAEAKYWDLPNHQRELDALRSQLAQSLPASEMGALLAQGATLSDEEAAHIALAM